jgi:hypothetical protein
MVMDLGRRFALGGLMLRFARAVGRTSGFNVTRLRRSIMNRLADSIRELGPYAAVALILPGGSLIAVGAWAFRHRSALTARLGRVLVLVAAFGLAMILPGKT